MGMQVIKTSFESTVHNICADLVHNEIHGSFVTAPLYAVSARVIAAVAHVWWLGNEVIQFVPHMIGLSVGVAFSEKPSFARAAQVYGLYFKTLGAQAVVGTAACVMPEMSHYALQLHKPLFTLQLEAFIETLPDLPHIQKDLRKAYMPIDSLAALYKRLGISNSEWKQQLQAAVLAAYRKDPNNGPHYLTTASKEFHNVFFRTLFYSCAQKINAGKLTKEMVNGLHPAIWKQMIEYLTPENQVELIELLKETIIDHEINNYFLELYKQMTGYGFRAADSVTVLRLYLAKMIEVRDLFVNIEKRFTQDEIESIVDSVIIPMRVRGFVRLLESAGLEGDVLRFGTAALSEDFHFFGEKQRFVELKKAHMLLTDEEKAVLITLCHNEVPAVTPTVNCKACFTLLMAFYWEVIDKKTNLLEEVDPFSKINWVEAFVF